MTTPGTVAASDGVEGTPDPDALSAGAKLTHRYELVEMLGRGGMGEVWKARHILLRGERAIKVIARDLSEDPDFRNRFLKEGQVMMRVRHPGIVTVTDLDIHPGTGRLFMVMEYLEGRTLHDAARDPDAPLGDDPREAARVLREVALGMQRIHDEQVVHKDLKSDNVLLVRGRDGLVHSKVIDFGVSKDAGSVDIEQHHGVTAEGRGTGARTTLAGTPAYIAPELFRGQPSSFRSDIYSFGVLAYEVLSRGSYPIARDSAIDYFRAHREGTSPLRIGEARPDLDGDLARRLDLCLSPDPAHRPVSFLDVADGLQEWLDAPERRRRRRRFLATAGTVAGLAAVAAWGIFFSGRTVSLGPLQVRAGGTPRPVRSDGRLHVPGSALGTVELEASLEGRPGVPRFEVDGVAREAALDASGGRLRAAADLEDLPDGAHILAIFASEGGAATSLPIVVDRVPPAVLSVTVEGAAGRFTGSQAPVVLLEIEGDAGGIDAVTAEAGGRILTAVRPAGGTGPWTLSGTAERDGAVVLDIRAADLAGNESRTRFEYVRDTTAPEFSVSDLYAEPGGPVVQVRRSGDAFLEVSVPWDESTTVQAAIDGAPPVEAPPARDGVVRVPLPTVSSEGFPVRLTVRDAAGNESLSVFRVRAVEDEAALRTLEGSSSLAVRGDGGVPLELRRSYSVGREAAIGAVRLLDARGEPVPSKVVPLPAAVVFGSIADRSQRIGIAAGALEPGVYRLEPSNTPGARATPFLLTVDPSPPVLEAIRVRTAGGKPPLPSGWLDSPDLVVEVEVRDLSPAEVRLGDAAPREAPRAGLRTYTFDLHRDREGTEVLPLTVVDAAGNRLDEVVTVRADWTPPRLAPPAEPDEAREYDDVDLTAFAGACSEAPFTLEISVPGRPAASFREEAASFRHEVRLPAGDPVEVVLRAVDPAGHASGAVRVPLRVRHRETELQPETLWSRGVEVRMRRVDPGEIVFAGRGHSVGRVFLDRTEVTNGQYAAFLRAAAASGGHGGWCHGEEPPGWCHEPPAATWRDDAWNAEDLPVVNVAFWDAHAFARWTARRLPTEAEWVKGAARAAGEEELRSWPPFPPGEWRDGVLATEEFVGDRKRPLPAAGGQDVSPSGCLHMGGNVSEWVLLRDDRLAAVRGGNWFFTRAGADIRSVVTRPADRSLRAKTVGFRCAMDAGEVRR